MKFITLVSLLLFTSNQLDTIHAGKPVFSSKKSGSGDSSSSSSGSTSKGKKATALRDDMVVRSCRQRLDFVSINDFRAFIEHYESKTPKQLLKDKSMPSVCVDNRDAILALANLITTKQVCDPSKIDALIAYHEKYFKPKRHLFGIQKRRRSLAHKFFTKYAIQVAHTCKKNLLNNIEFGRDELRARSKVFEEAREKVYKEEPGIKSNIRLIEEQANEPVGTNVKPRDDVESNLDEYRVALAKLKRPEDILTFDRSECVNSPHRRIKISKDKVQTLFKPSMMCLQLARYYGGSILSIAKLANAGYMALDEELDVKLADSQRVKDWIIATQVCEPLLHASIEKVVDQMAIIDTCSERVDSIEMMVYEDHLEELDSDKLEEMLHRNRASRKDAQRIMKSVSRKMMKADLMRKMRSGEITKKSTFIKSLKITEAPSSTTETRSCVAPELRYSIIEQSDDHSCDAQSVEELMKVISDDSLSGNYKPSPEEEAESPVSAVIPTSIIVIGLMLIFEWVFFLVMTLAARVCHKLNLNFDNLLTFPPKVFRRSDADFVEFTAKLDKIDEDDFFDYNELSPEEQKQRDLLGKIFGRPPPMLFREL